MVTIDNEGNVFLTACYAPSMCPIGCYHVRAQVRKWCEPKRRHRAYDVPRYTVRALQGELR
jgi:hypothetical protein